MSSPNNREATEVSVKNDTTQAIDFLMRYSPGGPWWLTAIHPDMPGPEAATFRAGEEDKMAAWIEKRQGMFNLYFQVNPLSCDLTWFGKNDPRNKVKAQRTDVVAVRVLHVDLDPGAGESQDEAKLRLVKMLEDYVNSPPIIICSGGGVQGFWPLEEPIPIEGDVAKAEDVKRFNIQLECDLGADKCHNIDRIMRLPGTVNLPNKSKRKKGRRPALAHVYRFDDRRCPNAGFTKASASTSSPTTTTNADFELTKAVRLHSLENLNEWRLPAWVKLNIEHGDDIARLNQLHVEQCGPAAKSPYQSRSESQFAASVVMVRTGVPDEIHFGLLTDERYGISASVLEKGRGATRYVLRQIQRAREHALDPDLADMNAEHAVVRIGGKTRVLSWDDGPLCRSRKVPVYSTVQDFCAFHNNRRKEYTDEKGNTKRVALGNWWINHELRRQYDGVIYAPHIEEEVVDRKRNLWSGFSVEPNPGGCSLYLSHLRENICAGNEEYFQYLIRWMARAVQHPNLPGEVAVVLRGQEGTGKGFFARSFGELFGPHFLHVTQPKHLVGAFNRHLQDCSVLFADEAFFAGDKEHGSVLKAIITEPTLMIEPKGVDAYAARNCIHLIMASNSSWVVPAGPDARRYFVLDVIATHMQDSAYFGEIRRQMETGGSEALLHFLMSTDVSNFDVRNVPKTDALADQKAITRKGVDALVEVLANEGRLPYGHKELPFVSVTTGEQRGEGFWQWVKDNIPGLKYLTSRTLVGLLCKEWNCTRWHAGSQRGIAFPPLADLRAAFDAKHGKQEWDFADLKDWSLGPI